MQDERALDVSEPRVVARQGLAVYTREIDKCAVEPHLERRV